MDKTKPAKIEKMAKLGRDRQSVNVESEIIVGLEKTYNADVLFEVALSISRGAATCVSIGR